MIALWLMVAGGAFFIGYSTKALKLVEVAYTLGWQDALKAAQAKLDKIYEEKQKQSDSSRVP